MTKTFRTVKATLIFGLIPVLAHAQPSSPPTMTAQYEQPSPVGNTPDLLEVTGGFGGVDLMYTRLAGHDVPAICGEGGVILGKALTLGGGGCGVAAAIDAETYGPAPHDPDDRLGFGYGGLISRYHFFSNDRANLAVGFLVGAGGLAITAIRETDEDEERRTHMEGVFVFEPQLAGYVNITRWMRAGVKGGYRLVSEVQTAALDSGDVDGFAVGGQLQFGWF